MITYKIDKTSQIRVTSQIKDMAAVLQEMPNTLQVLHELLEDQKSTISSPSINQYREDLQIAIVKAIEQTRAIAEESQKLAGVSDQASKHLSAIEEHFGAVLRNDSKSAAEQAPVQV